MSADRDGVRQTFVASQLFIFPALCTLAFHDRSKDQRLVKAKQRIFSNDIYMSRKECSWLNFIMALVTKELNF